MSVISPSMGLIEWTSEEDPYDHTQLVSNWNAIDAHNHTTGKGVQIPTGGIVNEAITSEKIAKGAVIASKIAAGAITSEKLASGVTSSLGDVKYWWRPNSLLEVPSGGWVIAAGQTLSSSEHEFPGGGSIILPNLVGYFLKGVITKEIGTEGGEPTINISHSHGVNPHTHTIEPHSHGLDIETEFNAATGNLVKSSPEGNVYVHASNEYDSEHRHGVNGNAEFTGLTTNATGGNTNAQLSTEQPILPPYIGLLPLLKVKNN